MLQNTLLCACNDSVCCIVLCCCMGPHYGTLNARKTIRMSPEQARHNQLRSGAGREAPVQCTIAYAAPEVLCAYVQPSRIVAQPAQDVYALGVMVFEVLTHARVFPSSACAAALTAATGESQYPWEVPETELDSAFCRSKIRNMLTACLSREPNERPTAAQLCEQLIAIGDSTLVAPDAETADHFVMPKPRRASADADAGEQFVMPPYRSAGSRRAASRNNEQRASGDNELKTC